ncbi:MAG: hypothetical protein HXY18_09655 [Bryobacteraceae bacterium]|nr:hypothetical protein [Bryobacteraceae bacterium]
MLPLTALFFLLAGDFKQFLSELKRSPPCSAFPLNFPVERPPVWSEHYGPRLINERVIQLAPGVAVISGDVVEVGPPFGFRRRPVRIIAVLHHRSWSIHTADCGPEPSPFAISRLAQ